MNHSTHLNHIENIIMIYFIQLNRGGNNGLNYVIHWIQTPFSLDYNTKINIFLKYTTHAITCCYNIFHMLLVFSHSPTYTDF